MTTALDYKPNVAGQAILAQALTAVQSVPYSVTARWLFYRLFQDGIYSDKGDYKSKFLPLVTRARKHFYGGWAPDTLADDSRNTVYRGFGYVGAEDWLERKVYSLGCNLDKWEAQPNYVEVWFEAAAMRSQFEHYTRHITLRPFKGDPSLDFKWGIAKHLELIGQNYPEKPIVILYFGDLDSKGKQIPLSARDDILEWCKGEFEFIRCGLNEGDELLYNLPENIDKPGAYQWEALGDSEARGLILSSLSQYVDPEKFEEVEQEERDITAKFKIEIASVIERWT
ncbi:MAG: hypothetical protein Q7O66_23090 [Dehalococcoidia bacterium]|nr:hypothetical protein [Dehalococcoidia bacterium]